MKCVFYYHLKIDVWDFNRKHQKKIINSFLMSQLLSLTDRVINNSNNAKRILRKDRKQCGKITAEQNLFLIIKWRKSELLYDEQFGKVRKKNILKKCRRAKILKFVARLTDSVQGRCTKGFLKIRIFTNICKMVLNV